MGTLRTVVWREKSQPRQARWWMVPLIALVIAGIPASAAPFAYVGNASGITVIDMATNSVAATLPVGNVAGLALTPDGTRLYATSEYAGAVLSIDTATNAVVTAISVGYWTERIAITPDGKRAYVTTNDPSGAGEPGDGITVIDTSTNAVAARIRGTFVRPEALAITPNGARVYVTNAGYGPRVLGSAVSVIDTATNTVVAGLPESPSAMWYQQWSLPGGIAITPDGSRAYVSVRSGNQAADLVLEADLATNTTVNSTLVGYQPLGLAMRPDGLRAYVANVGENTISVIHRDTTDSAWCCGIPVPTPVAVAVTADGAYAYVVGPTNTTVIDTATESVVATIAVTGTSIAIRQPNRYVFSGFFAPVSNPPVVNTGRAGRTYPVRWRLTDSQGASVNSLSILSSITYQGISCSTLANDSTTVLDTTASGGSSLRYDTSTNQFLYNWASPGAAGCYRLQLTLTNGQSFAALFNLK